MLTDDLWADMQPLVSAAKAHKGVPPPVPPDRMFSEAVLYLARTGAAWRDLPAEFGAWDAVGHRFRRWVASGGLRRLFGGMTADPQFGDVRRVLVDSPSCGIGHTVRGCGTATRPTVASMRRSGSH